MLYIILCWITRGPSVQSDPVCGLTFGGVILLGRAGTCSSLTDSCIFPTVEKLNFSLNFPEIGFLTKKIVFLKENLLR